MLNRLTKPKEHNGNNNTSVYQPSLMDSSHSRVITRQSVLVLSVLLAFGSFINMINRGEVHISMWLSLGVSIVILAVVARVSASSRHLMVALNVLIAAMLLNIHTQVLHGVSALILWSIPFYLVWIMLYPTALVAIVGLLISGLTIHFAPDHPVVPPNFMLALSAACVAHFAKQALKQQLHLAASDSLTGALNRRYLLSQLETRRADFVRSQRTSSLVLIDVDGLKSLNDRFGHKTGDDVLKSMVDIARQRIRGSDTLFRIGGDEFALVLLDANAHSALKVSNEIRMLVKQEAPESLPDYAVSFGVCCVDDSASAEDWLEQADAALYGAKESGGDRAKMAE
jgi:diguanylate cyclase (GGDEF)-like protein